MLGILVNQLLSVSSVTAITNSLKNTQFDIRANAALVVANVSCEGLKHNTKF